MTALSNQQKGLALTFTGAMFMTFDTPVLRLIDGEKWTVLFWRALLMSLTVLIWWLVMRGLKKPVPELVNGKSGLLVPALFASSNISFILAIYNTTIANTVFILALTPLFAIVISFVWLKEKPGLATWLALAVSMFGVGIIVWAGLGAGDLFGNLMAMLTGMAMAMAFTIIRYTGKDMSMSPVLTGAITASIAFFISADLSLDFYQSFWMLVNGVIILPVAASLMVLGPRYISSAEVSLFLLLETVLAPIWVWLAVGETVAFTTFAGGAIILIALISHSLYSMRSEL